MIGVNEELLFRILILLVSLKLLLKSIYSLNEFSSGIVFDCYHNNKNIIGAIDLIGSYYNLYDNID